MSDEPHHSVGIRLAALLHLARKPRIHVHVPCADGEAKFCELGTLNRMTLVPNSCPFCDIPSARVLASNERAFAIRDAFPVSPGHTLIIPRRHIDSFFDVEAAERSAMLELLDRQKVDLDHELHPAAYNIGINDGKAAGQTVPHLHIHLIPRFEGDTDDPRGGVRWMIPDKARYWKD